MGQWWTVTYNGAKYGSQRLGQRERYAILDTGTALMYLTKSEWAEFEKEMEKIPGVSCSVSFGYC
jgi:hypothetical protein